jgi:hypothetical protein
LRNSRPQCRLFEVPAPQAANSIQEFQIQKPLESIGFLVPMTFRSSWKWVQRWSTNFGKWALAPFPADLTKKATIFEIFAVTKSSKVTRRLFPKRAGVGTYRPRPQGPAAKGCLLRKPLDGSGALGRCLSRFGFFEKGTTDLSRGGAAR